jgi:predicted oxidoreductase
MDPHPIAEAISSLKKAGKIKRFGVSNFTPSQIALIEKEIPVTANQVELSLTTNKLLYKGTLDDCMQHDRMAMAWSPLGTYFTKKNKKKKRIKKVMKKLRPKYNATDSQLLLAWILKHPAEVHPVIGTTNDTRLAESVRAVEIELELEDWFLLLKASQGHSVP